MSADIRAAVEAVLRQYTDPHLDQDPLSAGCVRGIDVQDGQVSVQLELGYAAAQFKQGWAQMLQLAIENIEGVRSARVEVDCVIAAHKAQAQVPALANVKNVIAVASGKGGVGKSTTAANLALALAREGARVGILDADIYGPSQGIMFGIAEGTRPRVREQKWFVPLEAHGVQVMSMAFLTDDNTPVVWRGPMVSGALIQLVTQTAWNDLDYLIIDMPPGRPSPTSTSIRTRSTCAAPLCSAASRRRTPRRASAPTPARSPPTARPVGPASASMAAPPPRARR